MIDRRLAAIGDNCIDVYLPPVGLTAVGGQALNAAVVWRRLGWASEYLGAVGDDVDGRRVLAALRVEGVATSRVQVLSGPTGVTHLRLTSTGDRIVADEDQGACARYVPTETDLDHLAGVAHVHSANLPGFRGVVRALAKRGVPMSYDFSTAYETEGLEGLDTAFYSWSGRPDDPQLRRIAISAHHGGARVVVATCGEHGSVVFEDGRSTVAAAPSIAAVDTCGAGDTYAAVLLSERLRGSRLAVAMAAASEAASDACLHMAAWGQQLETRPEASA